MKELIGGILAFVISFQAGNSILFSCLAFLLGWFYVIMKVVVTLAENVNILESLVGLFG